MQSIGKWFTAIKIMTTPFPTYVFDSFSATGCPLKCFVDLVVCRVGPAVDALDLDRGNEFFGRLKIDSDLICLAPVLHQAVGAQKPAKVAAVHGIHPSRLNLLNGSNQSWLAIGSIVLGLGFASCRQSSIRGLHTDSPTTLKPQMMANTLVVCADGTGSHTALRSGAPVPPDAMLQWRSFSCSVRSRSVATRAAPSMMAIQ